MAAAASSTSSSSWTHKKLVKTVINDEPTLIHWLQTKRLLAPDMTCPECGSQCCMVRRRSSYSWRCPTKGCQAIKSIREGSFFGRSHLGLDVIVELMYFWSKKVRSSLLKFIIHIIIYAMINSMSRNFVDPGTGAHTNSIEGYWSVVKRQMRRQGVMNTTNDLFPTYLLESLWRKCFCGEDLFEKLFSCISYLHVL